MVQNWKNNKMYRYNWCLMDRPQELKTEVLEEKLGFYRFLRFWNPDDNELLDRIQDILDELTKRGEL